MQVDDLEGTVSLTVDGEVFKIPLGNINLLEFFLRPWGFEGKLGWVVTCDSQPDKFNAPFQKNKPIKAEFDLMVGLAGSDSSDRVPLKLDAWITGRHFKEQLAENIRLKSNKELLRYYHVNFIDPARLFWKQHFPQKLYANTTYKAIFTEQSPTEISLKMDWDVLEKQKQQIMITAIPEGRGRSSFYDFVMWFVYQQNGVFYYDYANKQYVISGKKPTASGKPAATIAFNQIAAYEMNLANIDYASIEVINASATNAKKESQSGEDVLKPIVRDYLSIWDIPAQFTADCELIKSRPGDIKTVVNLDLAALPLVMMVPWNEISMGQDWSSQAWPSEKKLVVENILASFSCEVDAVLSNYNNTTGKFVFTYRVQAYESGLTCVAFPDFVYPDYPVQVEGNIVSDQGDEKNLTFSLAEDSDTKVKYYQAEIPVFEKIKVQLPYQPDNLNGQFFFPPYRNQKVSIALWLESSAIDGYVDWRTNTPQTVDSQGNHIVLGQSETSQTTLRHYYTDNKPQLDINRVLEKDSQMITLSEGSILLHTVENS